MRKGGTEMMDPLTCLYLGADAIACVRLGLEVGKLRFQTRLAQTVARLPAGAELTIQERNGTVWTVRKPAQEGQDTR
jgi:hypothetical protein